MNKLILLLALLSTQLASSQAFISEEKLWHVMDYSWDIVKTQLFKFEGDTIINSHTYKILWSDWDTSISYNHAEGYYREESNVVYRWDPSGEHTFYNFNLETGDTATVFSEPCGEVQVVVVATDTIDYFGIPRKRWILEGSADEYWIEGIGSNYGLIYTRIYECTADIYKVLLCFHEDDVLSYILDGETECYQTNVGMQDGFEKVDVRVFPNPVKSGQLLVIQFNKGISRVELYHASGTFLKSFKIDNQSEVLIPTVSLSPGFYFAKIQVEDGQIISGKIVIR